MYIIGQREIQAIKTVLYDHVAIVQMQWTKQVVAVWNSCWVATQRTTKNGDAVVSYSRYPTREHVGVLIFWPDMVPMVPTWVQGSCYFHLQILQAIDASYNLPTTSFVGKLEIVNRRSISMPSINGNCKPIAATAGHRQTTRGSLSRSSTNQAIPLRWWNLRWGIP